MAKKIGKLARRYAQALLDSVQRDLGSEGKPSPAQKIATQLSQFVQVWLENEQLVAFVLSPRQAAEHRLGVLTKTAQELGVEKLGQRFFEVLFERERLYALGEIVEVYSHLADRASGALEVEVRTARSLAEAERGVVEKSLSLKIEGEPEFRWTVDESIYGGIIVSFAGKVLDGSLRGRLEAVERSLLR